MSNSNYAPGSRGNRTSPPVSSRPSKALELDSGLEALQASPEFRGTVERLEGNQCTDHLAHIFSSTDDQLATLVPFMRQGIERDERCMYVIDETSRETILAAMRESGIDVDAARESGQLSIHTLDETYLRGGNFDVDEMLAFYGDMIEQATESYEGLRVSAETTFLTADSVSFDDFMTYESRVNDLFHGEDCIALCQYDRRVIPSKLIRDVVQTHPHLIWDRTVCHNFYYTPPVEFLGPDEPDGDVDRMLRTLVDRTEAKAQLHESQQFLRALIEVTASPDLGFEEKLQRMFELGIARFGLELGGVAKVDADADRVEVEHVSDDAGHLAPGIDLPLGETYCRGTTRKRATTEVLDPCAEGFDDAIVHREFGFRTYFGTFVPVEEGSDRTLFFVSTERRDESFTAEERTFLRMMGQWTRYELERHRRERTLAALNRLSRELMEAEDVDAIAESTVEYARDDLGLPLAAVLTYDKHAGALRAQAETTRAADELPTTAMCDPDAGRLWEAFVENETRSFVDVDAIPGSANDLTEVLAIPLGRKGLFVTATAAPGGFSRTRREFVETTTATVEAALTRADRERLLQKRERTLEEQNETLRRLDRISTTIREIDTSLVQASSRAEIESVVCERLADMGPYELAWIGEYDRPRETVTPREWAGTEKGFLEEFPVDPEDPTDVCPAATAVETREPQVVHDVLEDPDFESRRQAALNRGYQACMAIPLVYRESFYGVLELYAGTPDVFDELARDVLTELSDTIAYAINTVESKKAMARDDVVELEFTIPESALGFDDFTARTGCELTLESLVPTTDGGVRAFFSTRGIDRDKVVDCATDVPVSDVSIVSANEDENECLFEAALTMEPLIGGILEHGGTLYGLHAAGGTVSVTIHVASSVNVRQFVEMVERNTPSGELVAQRSRERPGVNPPQARKAVTDDLTDRQLEVLQTAFFSGYFEEPRARSSQEIADRLGISQPTFSTHLRTAQRKLGRQLFDGSSPGA